jgi:hypothetical protein
MDIANAFSALLFEDTSRYADISFVRNRLRWLVLGLGDLEALQTGLVL